MQHEILLELLTHFIFIKFVTSVYLSKLRIFCWDSYRFHTVDKQSQQNWHITYF